MTEGPYKRNAAELQNKPRTGSMAPDNEATQDIARHTAELAMLAPDTGEDGCTESDFAAIVAFADELKALDSSAPCEPDTPRDVSALRRDEARTGLSADEALMNARNVSGRLITVPRTFE